MPVWAVASDARIELDKARSGTAGKAAKAQWSPEFLPCSVHTWWDRRQASRAGEPAGEQRERERMSISELLNVSFTSLMFEYGSRPFWQGTSEPCFQVGGDVAGWGSPRRPQRQVGLPYSSSSISRRITISKVVDPFLPCHGVWLPPLDLSQIYGCLSVKEIRHRRYYYNWKTGFCRIQEYVCSVCVQILVMNLRKRGCEFWCKLHRLGSTVNCQNTKVFSRLTE